MKSINDRKSHGLGTGRTLRASGRYDGPKERLETDAVLSVGFATVIALGIAMGAGLYSWSRHAPVFLHPSVGAPAIGMTLGITRGPRLC